MSNVNDWGSNLPKYDNPLKKLGFIKLIFGLILCAISIILLLQIPGMTKDNGLGIGTAWLSLAVVIITLGWGIKSLWIGSYMTFKMVIGRKDPCSLSQNMSNEEHSYGYYDATQLKGMLKSRHNATFIEPRNWIESLLYQLFNNFLPLPIPLRNLVQNYMSGVLNCIITLVCFTLVFFLGVSGMFGNNGDVIIAICSWFYTIKLIKIWHSASVINYLYLHDAKNISTSSLVKNIVYAVISPTLVMLAFEYFGTQLESIKTFFENNSITGWFYVFAIVPLIFVTPIAYMAFQRVASYKCTTEVSENISRVQKNVNPLDVFTTFNNIVMNKKRYMEVPNRLYGYAEPDLNNQTDGNKGNFFGANLQETQPVYERIINPILFNVVKFMTTVLGHIAQIGMAIIMTLVAISFISDYKSMDYTALINVYIHNYAMYFLLFYVSSLILNKSIFPFWSELKFRSLMVYYEIEGTFSISKISSGSSVYDHVRSENEVVRSNFTQIMLVTELVSTTFIGLGMNRFGNYRYIMEMHKNEAELGDIMSNIYGEIENTQVIAGITNNEDLRSAATITQISAEAESVLAKTRSISNDNDVAGHITN